MIDLILYLSTVTHKSRRRYQVIRHLDNVAEQCRIVIILSCAADPFWVKFFRFPRRCRRRVSSWTPILGEQILPDNDPFHVAMAARIPATISHMLSLRQSACPRRSQGLSAIYL